RCSLPFVPKYLTLSPQRLGTFSLARARAPTAAAAERTAAGLASLLVPRSATHAAGAYKPGSLRNLGSATALLARRSAGRLTCGHHGVAGGGRFLPHTGR